MKIAYVSYESNGQYDGGDLHLEEPFLLATLQQAGLQVHREIWNDVQVQWEAYDLLLLKNPWDYHEKYTLWLRWLEDMERLKIPVLNPISTIRWNMDKHYLLDVAQEQYPVIPSVALEKAVGHAPSLAPYYELFQTDQLIIKPCISGGARNTYRIAKWESETFEKVLHKLLQVESYLIQPYIPEISKDGEWSVIFFNGSYSHSILKKPKSGEFRVQQHFGGSVEGASLPSPYREQAQKFVQRFASDCLYARVDGVIYKDQFTLMELELIEPQLFLLAAPGSELQYLEALKKRINA
jgi:glutathione synthase/RimK-type ligase-like ATP-grasp enzyme